MNIENLKILRATMAANLSQVSMRCYFSQDKTPLEDCGTVSCIAGWAATLANLTNLNFFFPLRQAANWLGLTTKEAEQLSYGYNTLGISFVDITPEEVIAHLDQMIETQTLDWDPILAAR
jgi:hypothetical protein